MLQQGFGRSAEQNRGPGGDIRLKSGPYLLLFLLLHGGRPGSGRPSTTLENIYQTRDINLSRINACSVYHVLCKSTRGDNGVFLHRAGPRAMGHRRCLKDYDREKQRGRVLGSETISLVSCHMTNKPPQADSPESQDHICSLQSCHGAVVAPLSEVPQEGSSVFSLFPLIKPIWPPTHWLVATVV